MLNKFNNLDYPDFLVLENYQDLYGKTYNLQSKNVKKSMLAKFALRMKVK